MTKTPEELFEAYQLNKKRKTIREWKQKYNINISIEDFQHFKENRLKYLEILKLEEKKKELRSDILEQLFKGFKIE